MSPGFPVFYEIIDKSVSLFFQIFVRDAYQVISVDNKGRNYAPPCTVKSVLWYTLFPENEGESSLYLCRIFYCKRAKRIGYAPEPKEKIRYNTI